MFTCPENRPLVNPIPFKIGHSINPVPFPGGFGSMLCLAWSHAASQGKQDKRRWVGEVSPPTQGTRPALGIPWVILPGLG